MEILQTVDVSVPIDPGVAVYLTVQLESPAMLTEIAIDPGFRLLEVKIGGQCVYFVRPGDGAVCPIELPAKAKDARGNPCTLLVPGLDLALRVERVDKGARCLSVYVMGERR